MLSIQIIFRNNIYVVKISIPQDNIRAKNGCTREKNNPPLTGIMTLIFVCMIYKGVFSQTVKIFPHILHFGQVITFLKAS